LNPHVVTHVVTVNGRPKLSAIRWLLRTRQTPIVVQLVA